MPIPFFLNNVDHFLEPPLNFTILFLFYVCLFVCLFTRKHVGSQLYDPGIELTTPTLEGNVSTAELPGKSHKAHSYS